MLVNDAIGKLISNLGEKSSFLLHKQQLSPFSFSTCYNDAIGKLISNLGEKRLFFATQTTTFRKRCYRETIFKFR